MLRNITSRRSFMFAAVLAIGASMFVSPASASTQYRLFNHPDGSAAQPLYGLRLDELVNATASHDIFTFNFNFTHTDFNSDMLLDYDGSTIHIYGQVFGGRDTDNFANHGYADDGLDGVYEVDFTYTMNIIDDPVGLPDEGVTVTGEHAGNNGTITRIADYDAGTDMFTPIALASQLPVSLIDKYSADADHSFRFNNYSQHRLEDHPGYPYTTTGWGWLTHGSGEHVADSDWLFTGQRVPESGTTLALLGFALMGLRSLSRRTRRA